ncbi:MAG: LytTR family DNA-binding domain-containing protein [Bacteroidota bacterium]
MKLSLRTILILFVLVLVFAVFEAFQQLYYINRFELAQDANFWDLLSNQSYRWLIWGLLCFLIYAFHHAPNQQEELTYPFFLKHALLIMGLVGLNVLLIGLIASIQNDQWGRLDLLLTEYWPFFLFQKAPIFTLGYMAVSIIFFLEKRNAQLQFEIKSLNELQQQEQQKFIALQNQQKENPLVLTIKIGNSHKVISIENINYLEADDYCVRIHHAGGKPYLMRASLKAMEQQLPNYFFRSHRKYIVNINKVKEFSTQHTPSLELEDGVNLPIAKSRLAELKGMFALSE